MHEMSYAIRLVNMALDAANQNNLDNVDAVTVEVGQMTGVLPHLLSEAYQSASKSTILEGSKLDIIMANVTALCNDCSSTYEPNADNAYRCPTCKSLNSKIIKGRDVSLISIIDYENI